MDDVLIVGAGPAGSVAATLLARAGAQVRLIDRAVFPRDKLCGDTVNPGTLAVLRRLGLADEADGEGLPVEGMIVSGEGGVSVTGRYPRGLRGRAICRRKFDSALVEEARRAGVSFEDGTAATNAIVRAGDRPVVVGAQVRAKGARTELRARVTIAADGRCSALARELRMGVAPRHPRRWAIGAYFHGVHGVSALGEMHIRAGRYIGIAPVPGGLVNVCLVKPSHAADPTMRNPTATLRRELAQDAGLRDRFADADLVSAPVVLGPLAVEANTRVQSPDGLLVAGDACGFIDPMTGDGLRFAVRGGELAAQAALQALEHGWSGVHRRLAAARCREFAWKWRFNRALRALVASPSTVALAGHTARVAPMAVRALIACAGDCHLA